MLLFVCTHFCNVKSNDGIIAIWLYLGTYDSTQILRNYYYTESRRHIVGKLINFSRFVDSVVSAVSSAKARSLPVKIKVLKNLYHFIIKASFSTFLLIQKTVTPSILIQDINVIFAIRRVFKVKLDARFRSHISRSRDSTAVHSDQR